MPSGIDPGWDTNPGKSRQAAVEKQLATKTTAAKLEIQKPINKPANLSHAKIVVKKCTTYANSLAQAKDNYEKWRNNPQRKAADLKLLLAAIEEAHRTLRKRALSALQLPVKDRTRILGAPTRDNDLVKQITAAKDFIQRLTNKKHRIVISSVQQDQSNKPRGYCQYDRLSGSSVYVKKGDIANTVHEIAHDLEMRNPDILSKCRTFLESRRKIVNSTLEAPQKLSLLTGNSGYSDDEVAIEDSWEANGGTVYSGKVYHPGKIIALSDCTEILSIGLERLFRDPYDFAKKDPEYFDFVVSVLR